MENLSLWNQTASSPDFPELKESTETKVAIIGGGIAGILCSYFLTQAGIDNLLLEAGKICQGTTCRTTAKITAGHNLIYKKIADAYGEGFALKYAQSAISAIKEYKNISDYENIDCDFKYEDNFIYAVTNEGADRIDDEFKILKKLNIPCSVSIKTDLPIPILSALKMPDQASFHPLKFLYAISKNLNIYENSKVTSVDIKNHILETSSANIHAEKIILCTHFPFINTPGYFFFKMYQQRSYVMAIKNMSNLKGMYIGCDEPSYSFRPYGDILLIGGSGHRCGHNETGTAYMDLKNFIKKIYPSSNILCQWSAQDCMSLDGIPYIGRFSGKTPDIYVATGFNKWGMTTSMTAAKLICDMIQGKKNDCEDLFSPSRLELFSSAKNILSNTSDTVKGLSSEQLKSDNPVCPHMGCKLTWNPDEKSWDCPCHGSRFDEQGNILSNPSQERLIFK